MLESYVSKNLDKAAELRFFMKMPKRRGRAKTIVTDGPRSYAAAMRVLGDLDRREMGHWLNNGPKILTSRLTAPNRLTAPINFFVVMD